MELSRELSSRVFYFDYLSMLWLVFALQLQILLVTVLFGNFRFVKTFDLSSNLLSIWFNTILFWNKFWLWLFKFELKFFSWLMFWFKYFGWFKGLNWLFVYISVLLVDKWFRLQLLQLIFSLRIELFWNCGLMGCVNASCCPKCACFLFCSQYHL